MTGDWGLRTGDGSRTGTASHLHLPRALRHRRLSEVVGQQVAAVAAVVHAVEDVVGGDEELHHVARIERSVALIACAAAASTSTATLALHVGGLTD